MQMARNLRPNCKADRDSWRIRRATADDCGKIAQVWHQALALKGHASWQWALRGSPEQQQHAVKQQLETKFLRKKAAAAARKLLMNDPGLGPSTPSPVPVSQPSLLGFQLPLPAPTPKPSPSKAADDAAAQKRQAVLAYLRRYRCPFCLVAEAGEGGRTEVVGYILLSVAQPQALLPPPFPTRAPRRFYVEAIAILPEYQKRGMGTALLAAAEKLGRRLRHSSIWLQVSSANATAQSLYLNLGYSISGITGVWPLERQYLMQKPLAPVDQSKGRRQGRCERGVTDQNGLEPSVSIGLEPSVTSLTEGSLVEGIASERSYGRDGGGRGRVMEDEEVVSISGQDALVRGDGRHGDNSVTSRGGVMEQEEFVSNTGQSLMAQQATDSMTVYAGRKSGESDLQGTEGVEHTAGCSLSDTSITSSARIGVSDNVAASSLSNTGTQAGRCNRQNEEGLFRNADEVKAGVLRQEQVPVGCDDVSCSGDRGFDISDINRGCDTSDVSNTSGSDGLYGSVDGQEDVGGGARERNRTGVYVWSADRTTD